VVSLVLASAPSRSRRQDTGLRRSDHRYRKIIWGLGAGGFANFMALYFVQPLLPSVAQNFDVSPAAAAATLSVPTIAMALTFIVVGPISDRWGRQLIMRVSLATTGVLAVAVALAPNWPLLLLARGLEGVALAGLPAVALAYLREEIHVEHHLRANSTYIMGTAVGGAAGRLLPGPLEQHLGWHGAAAAIGLLALAASVIMWFLLPHSVNFEPRGVRLTSLVDNTRRTLTDPTLIALCVTAVAAMGTFVAVYNSIGFRLEAAPFALTGSATLVYLSYPVAIAGPAVARQVAGRYGRGPAALGGAVLLLTGVILTVSSRLPMIIVGLGLLAFAMLATHSLTTGWTADRARRGHVGVAQASGTYMVANYLGSSVLGLLANQQWESHDWTGVITITMITGTAAMIAIGAALIIDREQAVHTRR
jgi:YNFM family putative membrane transporter